MKEDRVIEEGRSILVGEKETKREEEEIMCLTARDPLG